MSEHLLTAYRTHENILQLGIGLFVTSQILSDFIVGQAAAATLEIPIQVSSDRINFSFLLHRDLDIDTNVGLESESISCYPVNSLSYYSKVMFKKQLRFEPFS